MVTRKEQAEQTRSMLVSIALDLFMTQGYDATSVAQILERAEMARGALYHHFPDGKQSLFVAVVDVVDHQLHEAFDHVVNSIESPIEQILAGFDALMDVATDPAFARIVLIEAAIVMPGAWSGGSEYQLLRHNLDRSMELGEIERAPLDATASMLYGAARRSADFVARSDEPASASIEAKGVLRQLVTALRTTSP